MDGVAVIRELLVGDEDMLALVDPDQIFAGVLPAGTSLDALAINRVSSKDRNILAPGGDRHVTERIQVTALAASYPRLRALIHTAKKACADFIGSAAGLADVTVHTDTAGSDFMDEQASIHMGSQDFIVGFTEAR